MKTVKIAQLGDLHLDKPFTKLTSEKSAKRRRELLDGLKKAVEIIKQEAVDMVFLTGDLFDHNAVGMQTVKEVEHCLDLLSPVPTFLVTGNHDPLLPGKSPYLAMKLPPHVHLFTANHWEKMELTQLNAVIYGYSWNSPADNGRAFADFPVVDENKLNLAMVHAEIIAGDSPSQYLSVTPEDLQTVGVDYTALGHVHNRQVFTASDRIIAQFAGSLDTFEFGRTQEHGLLLGEVGKELSRWRLVEVATRRAQDLAIEITSQLSEREIACMIEEEVAVNRAENDYVTVKINGSHSLESPPHWDRIAELLSDSVFALRLLPQTVPDLDLVEAARRQGGVSGEFVVAVLQQYDQANDKKREFWQLVLEYGLAALAGRRVDAE